MACESCGKKRDCLLTIHGKRREMLCMDCLKWLRASFSAHRVRLGNVTSRDV